MRDLLDRQGMVDESIYFTFPKNGDCQCVNSNDPNFYDTGT